MMRNTRKKKFSGAFLALVASGLLAAACGGGGDRDNGLVLNATGIWRGPESISGSTITCVEVSLSNAIVDNSYTLYLDQLRFFPDRNRSLGDPCGAYLGVENNLTELAMNLRTIDIRYEAPGSSVQIPSHQIVTGFQVPAASSTLPGPSGQPNLVYVEMVGQFVPATIMDFLRENESVLPARPYQLNVYTTANGRSEVGKQYRSNEVGYTFTVDQLVPG
jgi:hypothetical protein